MSGHAFYEFWKYRVNLIYYKMNYLWNKYIKDKTSITTVEYNEFTNDSLVKAISEESKIDNLNYMIIKKNRTDSYSESSVSHTGPYNTGIDLGYTLSNIAILNNKADLDKKVLDENYSFVDLLSSCRTAGSGQIFKF